MGGIILTVFIQDTWQGPALRDSDSGSRGWPSHVL